MKTHIALLPPNDNSSWCGEKIVDGEIKITDISSLLAGSYREIYRICPLCLDEVIKRIKMFYTELL
jgi:hypothetical protein